ncbi:hypothetical protein ACJMK2_040725 [Sinanodonta woodiana]|uniref:Syntaxin-7 n=1 Tax=Sinanodonta woodiana TaxID=1069815 RepID=A0ABD3W1X7_SINWO
MASYGRGSFEGVSYQNNSTGQGGGNDLGKLSQTIVNNIQKITQNVAQIQKMVGQIGTAQDSEELRNRLHQTTHYTNQLAKDTNSSLKELAHLPGPANPSEHRQWKMQKERLTEEFSNALKNFQTVQRTAAEKERASVARARAHSSSFGHQPLEMKNEEFSTPGYSQTKEMLQMEEDVDLEAIREREDAIRKLEKDITDVNQIFKDLGMLVHEQGEMLDSIEANVETAEVQVQEGTQQLAKARDYQSKARRKKCCIIIVIVVILAIIAIIIGVSVPKNS